MLHNLIVQLWGTGFKCNFRWVCDSKSAIFNVSKHTKAFATPRIQPSNVDYLAQIRHLKSSLGSSVKPKWNKGHQSTSRRSSNDVLRNNWADELATEHRDLSTRKQSRERTGHVPEAKVSVKINGVIQVSQVEACLRFHINGYHMRHHLQNRYQWSDGEWDSIDLTLLGQFCRSLTPANHTAQVKFMNDQRHTGVRRFQVAKSRTQC